MTKRKVVIHVDAGVVSVFTDAAPDEIDFELLDEDADFEIDGDVESMSEEDIEADLNFQSFEFDQRVEVVRATLREVPL